MPNEKRMVARYALSLALCALLLGGYTQQPDHKAQARQILRAIERFDAGAKKPGLRPVRVVYLVPSDRDVLRGFPERVQRVVEDVQEFYRKGMDANGFGPRTFDLEKDASGKLVIHVVLGRRRAAGYRYEGGGDVVWREAKDALQDKGIDINRETILLMTVNAVEDGRTLRFDAPFYGSGSAQSGTGWVLDSSWLDPKFFPNKTITIDDGQAKLSLGRFNTKWIGGIAHELGHGFGLPHDHENAEEHATLGTALMGSGNHTYKQELRGEGKGTFLTFASAARLASHPCFTHCERDVDTKPDLHFDAVDLKVTGKDVLVTGRLRAEPPAYAAIMYNDPEGGSDYDAVPWTSVVDDKGQFRMRVSEVKPGKGELRLTICLVNGATVSRSYAYSMDDKGVITVNTSKPIEFTP